MTTTATNSIRTRREAIVNTHIEAETVTHDVAATVATFRHPRYEIPALRAIVDGAEAVNGLVSGLLAAFPDLYLHKIALYHADDAVIVEARFGGTQRGIWADIEPTGKQMEVQGVLIFVFEDDNLCLRESVLRSCHHSASTGRNRLTFLPSFIVELQFYNTAGSQ